MPPEEEAIPLPQIAASTRYPVEAFEFVWRGLDHTVHRIHAQPELLDDQDRHVSGQQLCEGLRDFAIEQYGRLARMMMARWNIQRTEDFGQIVFAMVEGRRMQATPGDSVSDFDNGFDFDAAFSVDVSTDAVPLDADITSGHHTDHG